MKLLKQYRKLHGQQKFPGYSILKFVPEIADLVAEFRSKRLLDYGCGAGYQYRRERVHVLWGVEMPTLYDPAVAEHNATLIGQFDGVICTDVLEHVPEDELPQVVGEIARFARQWAFISVCCRPSKHIVFEDGQNVHVTIHPFEWWQALLAPHFNGNTRLILRETK
ncbi:MAG: methyltransferase domain-containing protein [Sulfuricaulis sp.]|nr:methyltransferase domain-containing protein [Sulfuricaulis sp.]